MPTKPDHAQHARELAEACGLKLWNERVAHLHLDEANERVFVQWNPHNSRDHLAVVLREVERRGMMQSLVGKMFEVNRAEPSGAWWSPEYLMGLFASDPAVICEACYSVLCQQQKGT